MNWCLSPGFVLKCTMLYTSVLSTTVRYGLMYWSTRELSPAINWFLTFLTILNLINFWKKFYLILSFVWGKKLGKLFCYLQIQLFKIKSFLKFPFCFPGEGKTEGISPFSWAINCLKYNLSWFQSSNTFLVQRKESSRIQIIRWKYVKNGNEFDSNFLNVFRPRLHNLFLETNIF